MVFHNEYSLWNCFEERRNEFSSKRRVSLLCELIRKQIDQLDAFVLDPNALSVSSNKFDDFQLNLEMLKDQCRSLGDVARSVPCNESMEIKYALEKLPYNILKLLKKVSEVPDNSTAESKVKSVFSSFIDESKQIKEYLEKVELAVQIDCLALIRQKKVMSAISVLVLVVFVFLRQKKLSAISVLVVVVFGFYILPYSNVSSYILSGTAVNSPASVDPRNILVEYAQRCMPNYLHQNRDLWPVILSGFSDLFHRKTASSTYLLLYNEAAYDTVKCVADVISIMAERWWNATSVHGDRKSETIDGKGGFSFSQRKSLVGYVKERKINELRVNNFEHVPITMVKDFHFICDSFNPTIEPSIVILLLQTDQQLSKKNYENPYAIAEKTLRQLWSNQIDEDVLAPLLTRLVSYPIIVNPEPPLTTCC